MPLERDKGISYPLATHVEYCAAAAGLHPEKMMGTVLVVEMVNDVTVRVEVDVSVTVLLSPNKPLKMGKMAASCEK